jgi:hypothetical protein
LGEGWLSGWGMMFCTVLWNFLLEMRRFTGDLEDEVGIDHQKMKISCQNHTFLWINHG